MARPRVHPRLADRAWLEREYGTLRRSSEEIGAELGCSGTAVRQALHKHGIATRPGYRRLADPRLADPAWLTEQWTVRARSLADLAAELGCSDQTVRRALQRQGVAEFGRQPTVLDRYPKLADRAWLEARYQVAGSYEIAAEVGATHHQAVLSALRRHGIPVRSAGKAGWPPRQ